MTVPEAAALLGLSRNAAYTIAARDGELAGIPVIRVGEKRLVIPRAPFEKLLGISPPVTARETPEHDTQQLP